MQRNPHASLLGHLCVEVASLHFFLAKDDSIGEGLLHRDGLERRARELCPHEVGICPSDLVICEDSPEDNFVRGVTPDGRVYSICRNAHADKGEFAGACFSPDGETLFVNAQGPHVTFAITGPWARLVRA